MAGVSLCTLLLALTSCFLSAYSANLKCEDIELILSGKSTCGGKCHAQDTFWDYGYARTYKNRYCDKCHLEYGGTDCKDNSCPFMAGPVGTAVDVIPDDSEKWICPEFCKNMPQIPIKMTLQKTQSRWVCEGDWWIHGVCVSPQATYEDQRDPVPYDLLMSTAFKTSSLENVNTNTYAVRPISECKTKRYEDNFNSRVSSCWQWSSYGHMPQMAHLDVFWTDGEARLYNTFNGVKEKTQGISQCASISNSQPRVFHLQPCWMDIVNTEQRNKQFSIKPAYTYYRDKQSKSAPHDCRMRIVGANNENSNRWDALQPPSSAEWNINNHWSNPPTRTAHFYRFKPVFDAMLASFGEFNKREDKTVARWDFTIPCTDKNNKPQRSNKVYYAESGCTQETCVDFITKPCYDNVYRFDEMVCSLIERLVFPMKFSAFKDQIVPFHQRHPFMAYGDSHVEIWYDTTKVQVKKDTTITVTPNQRIAFTDDSTIDVSLIRDARKYSCKRCFDHELHGRDILTDSMDNDIIACRACLQYEKVHVTQSSVTYRDCVVCDPHQVRNPTQVDQCRKCIDIDLLTPMRRKKTATAGDTVCTTCQHFQYFDGNSEAGCIFLQTVTDNIKIVNNKAQLSGKDFYITDKIPKQIQAKFWRDNILPTSDWNKELVPAACIPGFHKPVTNVPRLEFTAWCGHYEMFRHQQAWVQVNDSSLYVPLNSDPTRTRVNTSVVELCGTNTLTQVSGNTTFDLACGSHLFSIVRSGFQDACTLCVGAKYTDKCWPTYVPGLEVYDDAYFLPINKAITPHPGTCQVCNARCDNLLQANSYIDPIPYSCWWNGTGRIPGLLGSTATNFSWYKQAPCTKCTSVKLSADAAKLVLACGNRVSYRRWLPDTVSGSEVDASRSIPSIQICCVDALPPASGTLCTETPAEFETFAQLKCRQTVDDTPPAFLPYCPPGWYVEPTCAADSPLWNPDCCVKCKLCRGGLFKLDAYKDCPGDEFFDAQDRGCTTKCLTNQYLRNDRCIKCEACE